MPGMPQRSSECLACPRAKAETKIKFPPAFHIRPRSHLQTPGLSQSSLKHLPWGHAPIFKHPCERLERTANNRKVRGSSPRGTMPPGCAWPGCVCVCHRIITIVAQPAQQNCAEVAAVFLQQIHRIVCIARTWWCAVRFPAVRVQVCGMVRNYGHSTNGQNPAFCLPETFVRSHSSAG